MRISARDSQTFSRQSFQTAPALNAWVCAAPRTPRFVAYARDHGYTIVSKDNDFRQYSFLYGPPPKVLWLSVRNVGTAVIASLLADHTAEIQTFDETPEQSLLVVEKRA
jgi:predicted nuclease of predicted toxin-antitoxin system